MQTFTSRRNLFGTLVNNSDSTILTVGDTLMNAADKKILTAMRWPFLERQFTAATVAATPAYTLPANISKVWSPYVTVGTIRYTPREAPSREFWDELNYVNYSADIPEWWYFYDGQLNLQPTPVTSGNVITINTKRIPIDLSIADFSTGTILTATNGSATVTGTGTAWNASMVGLWLRITPGSSANLGDGYWYEISAVTSSTQLTLIRAYSGVTISAGAAPYVIGQAQIYPEGYHELPLDDALSKYFTSIEPNAEKAKEYGDDYDALFAQMRIETGSKTDSRVLSEGIYDRVQINPNLVIRG